MKRKILISSIAILMLLLVLFVYERYRTKRIDSVIGVSQQEVETLLQLPNSKISILEISIEDVDARVKEILLAEDIATTKPIIRYTVTGQIRKLQYWLVDEGEGYYVVEAINTNL